MARGSFAGSQKLSQLQPQLGAYVRQVVNYLEENGISATVYDVYRSPAEQERRFKAGDTKARAGQSPHQYGLAFDVVIKQGEQSLEQRQLQAFWKALGFTVIDWDPAHVEYPNWQSVVR